MRLLDSPRSEANPGMSDNSESCSPKLSSYACSLNGVAKARYLQKLSCIGDFDPLLGLPRGAESVKPPVDACDLVSYFFSQPALYVYIYIYIKDQRYI